MINPYHVRVRLKKVDNDTEYTKMSLQLYQVDYKSYLLDFKSLSSEEDPQPLGNFYKVADEYLKYKI